MKQALRQACCSRHLYNLVRNYSGETNLVKRDGFSFLSQFDTARKTDPLKEAAEPASDPAPFNFLSYIAEKQKVVTAVYKEAQDCKTSMSNANLLQLQREFHECGTKSQALVTTDKPDHKSWDSYALEHMIACGLHLGHTIDAVNRNMAPYIYGVRQGIHIIDLDQTVHCLRRALFVTREIAKLGGIILIVGTRPSIRKMTYQLATRTNSFYIFEKWQRGTITNACYVVKKTGSFSPGTLKETSIRLPDLLIVLDGPSNSEALIEASMRSVPSICLTDTNMDPTLCTYPIPVNDDSISGTHFIVSLLENAILDGKSAAVVKDSPADDLYESRLF